MRIGALDRMIAVERSTPAQSASGEAIDAWALLFTCHARVTYPAAREIFASGQVQGQLDALFRIRRRTSATPTTADRIRYDGKTYDIVSVNEVGRREGWDIVARARNV